MTIHRDISIEAYHAQGEFVSHSRLRDFVANGARFFHDRYLACIADKEETEALRFGQAFEVLYQCGGPAFSEIVAVRPRALGDGRTTAAKAFAAGNAGKWVISEADYEAMLTMVESLHECEDGVLYTQDATPQVTLRGEAWGLKLQSRPDWIHLDDHGGSYIVDLKTTKDLADLDPGNSIWKLGYHTQAALARKLLALNGYPDAAVYLWVVEKGRGFRSECIRIREDALAWGDEWLAEHAPRLAACFANNEWRRATRGVVEIGKPRWATSREAPAAP